MSARRLLVVAMAAMLVAPLAGARAETPGEQAARACRDAGGDPGACATLTTFEDGVARAGLTAADRRGDARADVSVADFYFSPRVSIIRDGQTVAFTNDNAPGGNPHSVSSSDIGGTTPVLPVPGDTFGGGAGFRSGKLTPGSPFTLTVDMGTLDPRAYVLLPNGDALIAYHCYIHGAGQMNGFLLVTD